MKTRPGKDFFISSSIFELRVVRRAILTQEPRRTIVYLRSRRDDTYHGVGILGNIGVSVLRQSA
jgi:hypothetical protein